jgi:hypothetical protein
MTVIVAVKDDEGISIGADRRIVSYDAPCKAAEPKFFIKNIPIVNEENEKIDEKNVVIGVVGYMGINSYVNHSFNMPPMDIDYTDTLGYLIYAMMMLRMELDNNNLIKCFEGKSNSECGLLIIMDNKIFNITPTFHVLEVSEDYYAEGSAYEIALGSLYTIRNMGDSSMKVETAIRACNEHSIYVDDNIDILKVFNDGNMRWEKQV